MYTQFPQNHYKEDNRRERIKEQKAEEALAREKGQATKNDA
jgi:hypothetical protein